MISPLGKRQPRALVIGLRRVIKDSRATVAQRLEACKLLARIEGYNNDHSQEHNRAEPSSYEVGLNTDKPIPVSAENSKKLKQLLEKVRDEKSAGVSRGFVASEVPT
jgi:hypothetical protein